MKPEPIPYRDTRRIVYFVKSGHGIEIVSYAVAVLCAADPKDHRTIFHAWATPTGKVAVDNAGMRFTALAKRAVRSAQRQEGAPRCKGSTLDGTAQCKVAAVTTWHDLDVCAMHDPEGEYAKANPAHAARVLEQLREIKAGAVERLEDRLTALLLERYGPSKGRGIVG